CVNKRVDGVYIVVGNYQDKGIYELIQSDIPCISNDMILEGLHTVVSDNNQGVLTMLKYVKDELKKQTIGMIVGPQQSKAFQYRYKAFERYVNEIGLFYQPEHIVNAEGFGFTSGYQAAQILLKQNI